MAQTRLKDPPDYGGVPFTLEASDVTAAISMGILHSNVPVQQTDATAADYGVAYNRRDNVGTEFHASQRAIQDLCKEFSQTCGFQLKVASFSAKRNGSGNAKYVCKKLNGQQFFDKNASEETLSCPIFIYVSGVEGFWKATRANFCHNHVKRVGFSSRPVAEGSAPFLVKDKRNTTQNVEELARLVETEMLPLYEGKLARVKGTAIAEFLKGKGFTLGPTAISRVKQAIEATHEMGRLTSYQKLESYLKLMTEKNPGSLFKFEKEADGTFKRACFSPNIGIRMATMGRRLYGVDGAHLKGEMNNYGVFLVATAKDYDNHILPFGFSMVLLENFDNWLWFLQAMKQALNIARFTLISDRQKGLLSAVPTVFPEAGHRFCLRHIKSNINSKGISLTGKERGLINDMARSDCENDYKLFEKQLASTKPGAVEYLRGIDKKHWVKFAFQEHFKLPTYNETTSNLAEQSNNWIGDECRSAKPLEAFGIYFRKLSELVSNRRQMAANWMMKAPGSQLVPMLSAERKKLAISGEQCKFTPCMEGAYNVLFVGSSKQPGWVHPWRMVNLPDFECTCGNWQDNEFPCIHAIPAAVTEGQRIETLYDSKRLSIDHFRDTYMIPFRPWPTDVTLQEDTSLKVPARQSDPPEMGKRGFKPGPRPKHKRRKSKHGD